jgi:hypothetical protein
MDGIRRTDATFFRPATKDLTSHGRSGKWHHMHGWKRTAWRIGIAGFIGGFLYGFTQEKMVTIVATIAAAVIGLILGALYLWVSIKDWHLNTRVAAPLYHVASQITGHPEFEDHRKHLTIPRDYATNKKAIIRFTLPYTWEGGAQDQKRVEQLFIRRLGGEWDSKWLWSAHPPRLEFRPSPAPPSKVGLAEILPALESSDCNNLVLGIGTHDKIAGIDLDSESPHVALSMGTGGGKSSLIRLMVAQLRRHGVERIDIIDPKRISHNWAKDIPGVFIHRTMAQQMSAIHDFRTEMESRYDLLDDDDALQFPRRVLIFEEQNSWINYAKQYWADYRQELESKERSKVPAQNPAIGDLGFILFQGRQARMNVVSVYQRMSASAAGGGDLRENYYAKILARFSAQTFKLLVGSTPIPRSSKHNGRGILVLGDDIQWVQFAFLTESEAKQYAMSGDAPAPAALDAAEPAEPLVTLREAADAEIIPMRYAALRRARSRAGATFPPGHESPAGRAYRPTDLRTWHAERSGRGRAG